MKDKILAALKTKYTNLGFTDKALEGVATFLVASTTDEAQIDNAVSGAEPLLKAFQGDADSRVNRLKTENEELKKKLPAEETKPGKDDPAPTGGTETEKAMLATLTKMSEAFTALSAKVEGMETGAAKQSRQERLNAALDKAPASYKELVNEIFTSKTFATEEEFNTFLQGKVSGLEGFTKSLNEEGLTTMPKPSIAFPGKEGKTPGSFGEMMRTATENRLAATAEAAKTN